MFLCHLSNQKIVSGLNDQMILENLNKIQRANQIAPSAKLEGRSEGYNLTIEMETGVGKTYTYQLLWRHLLGIFGVYTATSF